MDELQKRRLLRIQEVISLCGIKRSCIYDRIRRGEFPPSISLGGRLVAWRAGDVEAFLNNPSQYEGQGKEIG